MTKQGEEEILYNGRLYNVAHECEITVQDVDRGFNLIDFVTEIEVQEINEVDPDTGEVTHIKPLSDTFKTISSHFEAIYAAPQKWYEEAEEEHEEICEEGYNEY